MSSPESYDELIRPEIRKMRPTKAYPYDPDFPYAVLNIFSDEGIARFRYESDAVDFAYEDLTLYVIDTTPKERGRPMTDKTPAELIEEARTHVTDEYITPDTSAEESLIRRLAAALEAAEERAEEAERELQVAEDQANNLAGDLAQAEKRAEEAERLAEVRRETIREYERENESWSVRAHTAERERDRLDEAFDRDLPWRYDEVEAQRNALAAVMESAVATGDQAWGTGNFDWYDLRDILATPATAPADALREHDAALIEELADELEGGFNSETLNSERREIKRALREKARKRREEKP